MNMNIDVDFVEVMGKIKIGDVTYGTATVFKIIDLDSSHTFDVIVTPIDNKLEIVIHDTDLVKYDKQLVLNKIIEKYTLKELLKL